MFICINNVLTHD